MPQPSQAVRLTASRAVTLALTNLIKLAGLTIAINEALFRSQLRPLAIAVAAFMMAGAQISEELLLALIARFFVAPQLEKPARRRP